MRRQRATQKPFIEIQKLKLDLDAGRRLMMRDPNYVMAVVEKYAPYNLMAQFGIALTGSENGLSEVNIGRRGWDESVVKWRMVDPRRPPIEIMDASTVPSQGNLRPGETFVMAISEGYPEPGAILETEDPNYQIMAIRKRESTGKKNYYDFQVISSNPADTSFRVALLQYNRKLSFTGNNAVGEKSAKGQSAMLDQHGYEEYYNLMQTMRTDGDISGHMLSTKLWTVLYDQFAVGSQTKQEIKGVIPFGNKVLEQHFKAISHALYYGRSNFDIATKRVLNQSPEGPYADRPTMSGLREFYYGTENQFEYNPRQPEKLVALLENAADIVRERMRQIDPNDVIEFKIITRTGGERAVRQAWFKYLVNSNQQLMQQLSAGGKVTVGYAIDKFVTSKGDVFNMTNIDYALPRDSYRIKATVDGYTADVDSWEIAIMPVYKISETLGRQNIQVITKKHTTGDGSVINRGLVIGSQMGMTGQSNSTGMDIGAMQTQQINKAYLEQYRVDSMIDQESFGALSELSMAVLNPDDIILLRPKLPEAVY